MNTEEQSKEQRQQDNVNTPVNASLPVAANSLDLVILEIWVKRYVLL